MRGTGRLNGSWLWKRFSPMYQKITDDKGLQKAYLKMYKNLIQNVVGIIFIPYIVAGTLIGSLRHGAISLGR